MEEQYNITVRIDEGGFYICDAATVRQDFAPGNLYRNEHFESVDVELTKQDRDMVYRFRCRYPATPGLLL